MFLRFGRSLRLVQNALAFYTQIIKPSSDASLSFESSIVYFGFAAAFFALLLLIPICLLRPLSSLPLYSCFLGFLWLAMEIWLSRALHWDGLCDFFDALGSGKEGDAFFGVMHDSRLGAFGATALVCVILGMWICASYNIYQKNWLCIFFAPLWARCVPIWLAKKSVAHTSSFLGRSICRSVAGSQFRIYTVLFYIIPLVLSLYLSPIALLLIPLQSLLLMRLRQCAYRNGGISGDFFGAGIELSQLFFLALAVFCAL